ncbi:hypothetical protein CTI12_AA003570 [Artemisia annua]|uniref:Helitron helicase-like domain-containing protein n=1 Tax=Artemisia annua TaxID=35608 RepID=A0A2U1QMR8_ARTAN|nr:hypothetical protein CTI12_AA003570 [Artemisia annua]
MKTKQKAVRRVPSSSCVPSLDLSLGVQHTDSESSAFKRKRPVIDNFSHDHSVQNMTKKICMQRRKPCHKHMVHKTPTAIEKTTATCNSGTSSTLNSTCNNSISNLDNHHVHENSILDSTAVQSNGAKHHLQASRVSGRNQRHFPRNSTPMEVGQRNACYQTTLSTMNTSDNGGRHRKRPRFIQNTQQHLYGGSNNTNQNRNQRRRLRQGHLQVMFPLAVAHKHANIVKLCSGVMNDSKKVPKHVQNTIAVAIMVLDNHNELVKLFRTARDKMEDADVPSFKLKLFGVVGTKQYDLPAGDSIGAIVFEGGPDVSTNYDVIIETRGGQPQRIDKLNPHYMALHFPILFIHGEEGYHLGLKLQQKEGDELMADNPEHSPVPKDHGKQAVAENQETVTQHEPVPQPHGKDHGKQSVAETQETVTEHEPPTNLLTLKPTDFNKSLYVKVYRKWTTINKASVPVMHSCILLDQKVHLRIHAQKLSKLMADNPEHSPVPKDHGKQAVAETQETVTQHEPVPQPHGKDHGKQAVAETQETVTEHEPVPQPHGKEIMAQPQPTNLLTLKPTDFNKSLYVKVYRKWTTINKTSVPVMHSCILLDQKNRLCQKKKRKLPKYAGHSFKVINQKQQHQQPKNPKQMTRPATLSTRNAHLALDL